MQQETIESTTKSTTKSKQRYWIAGAAALVILAGVLWLVIAHSKKTKVMTKSTVVTNTAPLDTIEQVMLSNTSVVRNGVGMATVGTQNFSMAISAVGVLEVPQPGERTVAARARGRIEKMYVAATGAYVHKGEPLFEFYSPDILSAEKDYLIAAGVGEMDNAMMAKNPGMEHHADLGLLTANRNRLLLYGLTSQQIRDLGQNISVANTVTITSPIDGVILQKLSQEGAYVDEGTSIFQLADLSSVWAEVEVPESEIRYIRMGQIIPIQTDMYPNQKFDGRVILISPVADQASRTVRVRVEVPNPQGRLRPGMTFISSVSIPMGQSLAIPQDAVIQTGKGDFVWVNEGENMFTAKEVQLGALSPDDYYQVLSGLNAGDEVAAQGAFLVDAEYQLSKNNPMVGMNMGPAGTKNSGEGTATVVSIDQAKQMITLNHGNIPGVMPAMTMAYKVSDPKFLTSVTVGESVKFTLTRMSNGEFDITAIQGSK